MLHIRQETLPFDHPDIIHLETNDYLNALRLFQEALSIEYKSLPEDHIDLANTYNNIGRMNFAMQNHQKALDYYQKTLQIQQKYLSNNHPSLATTYNNILPRTLFT